jgi:hypothetical protein
MLHLNKVFKCLTYFLNQSTSKRVFLGGIQLNWKYQIASVSNIILGYAFSKFHQYTIMEGSAQMYTQVREINRYFPTELVLFAENTDYL